MADEHARISWWCCLSRAELAAQIKLREEGWKRQKVGMLDQVGQKLRDQWEPRKPHSSPRAPIA